MNKPIEYAVLVNGSDDTSSHTLPSHTKKEAKKYAKELCLSQVAVYKGNNFLSITHDDGCITLVKK